MVFHAHDLLILRLIHRRSKDISTVASHSFLTSCMKIDLEKKRKKQNSAGAAGHVIIVKVPHNRIGYRTLEKSPKQNPLFLEHFLESSPHRRIL